MVISTTEAPATSRLTDPTQARYLTSYIARRAFSDAVQYPPDVTSVRGAIDIHCHAQAGQQDPLALAKHASVNGMKGILYKSIAGGPRPAESVRIVRQGLLSWCEQNGFEPVATWAGFNIGNGADLATPERVREQIADGVVCIWMPTARHANTINKVGGRTAWWDKSASPRENSDPLPWDRSLEVGHYLLDDRGRLKPTVKEIFRIVADENVAVSFGHSTHQEIDAMAEEVVRLGIKRAFADHPFSPFVDLSVEQMRQLTSAGITMNFTFDELSPLLGVDPQRMYDAIRALDLAYVTLSSDAGEPLFPNTVECMRLIRLLMRAFGLTEEEIETVSSTNPGRIAGL
jgi:Family of unknown function (DUF6282)